MPHQIINVVRCPTDSLAGVPETSLFDVGVGLLPLVSVDFDIVVLRVS